MPEIMQMYVDVFHFTVTLNTGRDKMVAMLQMTF